MKDGKKGRKELGYQEKMSNLVHTYTIHTQLGKKPLIPLGTRLPHTSPELSSGPRYFENLNKKCTIWYRWVGWKFSSFLFEK